MPRLSCFVLIPIFASQCFAQEEFTHARDLIDDEQAAFIEVVNFPGIVESIASFPMFQDPRWKSVEDLLTHKDFGLIDTDVLANLKKELAGYLSGISVEQMVIAVSSEKDFSWQVVIKSSNTASDMDRLLVESAAAFDGNFPMTREGNGNSFSFGSGESSVTCYLHDHWIVLSNKHRLATEIIDRLKNNTPFKRLTQSRRFRRIAQQHLDEGGHGDVFFMICPELATILFPDSQVDWSRALGLTELSAGGQIRFTRTRDDDVGMEFDCHLNTTLPRVGLADSVKAETGIEPLPVIPGEPLFLAIVHLRFGESLSELERVFDDANGEGSLRQFVLGSEKLDGLIGQPYFDSFRNVCTCMDGTLVRLRFNDRDSGKQFSLNFFGTKKPTEMLKHFQSMWEIFGNVSKALDFFETEIEGHTAVLSSKNRFVKTSFGYMCFDDWLVQGTERAVRFLTENDDRKTDFADETRARVSSTKRHFGHQNEPFAVVVTWPEYWKSRFVGSIATRIFRRKNLDSKEITEAITKLERGENIFERPTDANDVKSFAAFAAGNLLSEYLGDWTIVCSECDSGFRLSGQSRFPSVPTQPD